MTPENLKAVIADIGGPGWYISADLYAWYQSMAIEDGLSPVTKKKFGGVLREMGYRSASRRVNGATHRCWLIPVEAVQ